MGKEEALKLAAKYNLEAEITLEIQNGATPEEALREWDIL